MARVTRRSLREALIRRTARTACWCSSSWRALAGRRGAAFSGTRLARLTAQRGHDPDRDGSRSAAGASGRQVVRDLLCALQQRVLSLGEALLLAPALHHFLHRFHLEPDERDQPVEVTVGLVRFFFAMPHASKLFQLVDRAGPKVACASTSSADRINPITPGTCRFRGDKERCSLEVRCCHGRRFALRTRTRSHEEESMQSSRLMRCGRAPASAVG